MNNIPKQYHSAIRKLIKKAREDERAKISKEVFEVLKTTVKVNEIFLKEL